MENENKTFTYMYSAKQQEEVNSIRQKYIPKEENKMEQLRKLDKSTETPGTIISIIVGAIGVLLIGVGLCCTLLWINAMLIPGIVVGVIGIAGVALAYPLFNFITKKQREKLAPQIMRLSQELMDEK
ncbi:hypothetical protein P4H94_12970 [Paenibacillus macerans]|uniref:Uncharacterized protein n=1 Tax=Paenibacillus macerans TaxID=44252 RepID=A0A090ZPK7_PAEMA|nr:hypothetical protein [Paenibacillus macerans]KFN12378.1 hypothetical protein DJ90_1964 [Paenibacillus macerans]MBS5914301.1 hypothetical protein [Paenibacillus macerans]MCY7558321.1 hypothetical protein [Paenibacillus macerans]MEC0137788.1 hypothetical protein [Paenibacillus macerans]MEC0150307.1 hypothetical protein [Paenibacillus macerans]